MVVCAAMVAAALLWLLLPLVRSKDSAGEGDRRRERWLSAAAVAALVPVIALTLYAALSKWDWQAVAKETARATEMDQALQTLEAKLAENPNNLEGWLMLGRSYVALDRPARAVDAYQQAYNVSKGQNVDAVIGLGEALVLTDNASLTGRAGQLFDSALALDPNHPKALWYGSLASLQQGDLVQGRDRLKRLMAQNPPEQLKGILQRQIQDLDEQIAAAGKGGQASEATSASGTEGAAQGRSIRVAITLSPSLKNELAQPMPLFVLARDPSAGGPPLAVQRHVSSDLPLTVELSERDAMIPTRTIATVPRVQVVARLSRSGSPQAQSGDLYGEAEVEFGKQTGTLNIIIDRKVP
jgi:cytochrome c-type biogenesis protein CcmH